MGVNGFNEEAYGTLVESYAPSKRVYVTCMLSEKVITLKDALDSVHSEDKDVNEWHKVIREQYDIGSGQDNNDKYYLVFAKIEDKVVSDEVASIVHEMIKNSPECEGDYHVVEKDGYLIDCLWYWIDEDEEV